MTCSPALPTLNPVSPWITYLKSSKNNVRASIFFIGITNWYGWWGAGQYLVQIVLEHFLHGIIGWHLCHLAV